MIDQKISPLWRVSSWSNGTNCVEVAIQDMTTLVRDSKNRSGRILSISSASWREFVEAVKRDSIA
jgi:Domain of unknown function (DUF397)